MKRGIMIGLVIGLLMAILLMALAWSQRSQRRKLQQQLISRAGMFFGMVPFQFFHKMPVYSGRRNPAIMQERGMKQLDSRIVIEGRALQCHEPDTLTVADLVHPDQIEGIGEGIDGLAKVDIQFHWRRSGLGGGDVVGKNEFRQ